MRPVYQAIPGRLVGGRPGDCMRACLASLLEVELRHVPHVVEHPDWWTAARLAVRDLTDGELDLISNEGPLPFYVEGFRDHIIASGPSPRGPWLHSVLVDQASGELAHDPFRGGTGLAGPAVDFVGLVWAHEAQEAYGLPAHHEDWERVS